MSCSRYDNGKCASAWCYYKSAGDTCLNPRLRHNHTNADRIRDMSDEELAGLLHQAYTDGVCDLIRSMRDVDAHVNTISDYQNWLKRPAKEEHHA